MTGMRAALGIGGLAELVGAVGAFAFIRTDSLQPKS
jgi:hypothetical protein